MQRQMKEVESLIEETKQAIAGVDSDEQQEYD